MFSNLVRFSTVAALFGALPLAFGTGIGSELRRPLGITIVGGLIMSQLLTLYTTPVVYLFLDRMRLRFLGVEHDTLPEQAIADVGGGAIDKLVKGFLDRWAPEMCTDLFDFQHPHPRMTVRVAVHGDTFSARTYQEVVIDYRPSHQVNCVQPDNLVW